MLTVSTPGEIQFLSNGGEIYLTEITPTIQDSSLLGTKKPLVAGISVLVVSIAILFAGYRWYRSRTARTMVGHLNYGGQDISLIGKKSHVVKFNGYSAEFVAPPGNSGTSYVIARRVKGRLTDGAESFDEKLITHGETIYLESEPIQFHEISL